jgi:hypothetical protein
MAMREVGIEGGRPAEAESGDADERNMTRAVPSWRHPLLLTVSAALGLACIDADALEIACHDDTFMMESHRKWITAHGL